MEEHDVIQLIRSVQRSVDDLRTQTKEALKTKLDIILANPSDAPLEQ